VLTVGGQAKRAASDLDWDILHELTILGRSRLPNGSRLSCGRNARWRKAVQRQKKPLAGEATQFLPTCERPAASSAC